MYIQPSKEMNACQKAMTDRLYGMFIHFGINTFNDTEWSDGKLPLKSYKPAAIDADGWVKNAYEAGMNYVILITKHHDGFCLWDTKYTDYKVTNSPNTADVVKEVSAACKKYGVKLGLYYSLWDRHEKCYRSTKRYRQYMLSQLEELLTGYGEVVELWLDGAWDKRAKSWGIDRLYELTKKLQPGCAFAVNTNIGKRTVCDMLRGGYVSKKYWPENQVDGMPIAFFPSDFRLFDPHFPKPEYDPKLFVWEEETYYLPFEATICIRDMKNWFWDPKYTQDKLVSIDFIAEKYNQMKKQSNNLVINVAPNTDGVQEKEDVEHLLKAAEKLGIRRTWED